MSALRNATGHELADAIARLRRKGFTAREIGAQLGLQPARVYAIEEEAFLRTGRWPS